MPDHTLAPITSGWSTFGHDDTAEMRFLPGAGLVANLLQFVDCRRVCQLRSRLNDIAKATQQPNLAENAREALQDRYERTNQKRAAVQRRMRRRERNCGPRN